MVVFAVLQKQLDPNHFILPRETILGWLRRKPCWHTTRMYWVRLLGRPIQVRSVWRVFSECPCRFPGGLNLLDIKGLKCKILCSRFWI